MPNFQRDVPTNLPSRSGPTVGIHGAPAQELCETCGGAGYVLSDVPLGHPDFGKAIPCHCKLNERKLRQVNRFQDMGQLDAMARFTFDNFHSEPSWLPPHRRETLKRAYEAATQFAAQPHGWIIFYGGFGCGKTHLAAAIANYRLDRGQSAIFAVVPDLLDHLRMTFGSGNNTSYDELFHEVRETSLLILDDLGVQSSTPWAQEKLFQILNHRYNGRLPTILTTNQRLEDLDQRLRSRLHDIHLVQRFHINAPDYRGGTNPSQADLSTISLHSHQRFESFDIRRRNADAEVQSNLRRVRDAAEAYAQNPTGWFVLSGPSGAGKTHLAAAIANVQFEMGQSDVMFVVVPDFLDYLRAAFNPQSPIPYDRRFDELKRAPLLVLDDLGTESATPWAREKLFQLLNFRYSAVLPTVITTSDTPGKIEPWLRTRMMDTARCEFWVIKAGSYRGSADQDEASLNRQERKAQPSPRHQFTW